MRGMRYQHNTTFRILSLLIALLTLTSSLEGQTGDWQAVRRLDSGIPVSVKVKRSYYCIFQYVTDDELVCGVPRPIFRYATRIFPRAQIREVRKLPNPDQMKSAKIGAGIGAATLATAGAIRCTKHRAECAPPAFSIPVAGLIGAFVGSLVGMAVPLFQVFRRGKVIYKG